MDETPPKKNWRDVVNATIKRLRAKTPEEKAETAKEGAEAVSDQLPDAVVPRDALKRQKAREKALDELNKNQ